MITLTINDQQHELDVPEQMPLLWALRDVVNLTGTKFGCGMGLCGACTVHLDGAAVRSCVTPVAAAAGKHVTTIEAMAAVLGGTQSLHTNAFDEAIALPTPFSARIARNTQIILAEEAQITRVVDPLGGSYYIESLTDAIVQHARKLIEEVEELGGMTQAVDSGMPKQRIEEAAAQRQSRIERGEDVIVGVNKYKLEEDTSQYDVLAVENAKVREAQVRRLEEVRRTRDDAAVQSALDALTAAAQDNSGNLLDLSVKAARARATVGEISMALEKAWGRHRAVARMTPGVYADSYNGDEKFSRVRDEIKLFTEVEGEAPSILVVKMGQDGHDRGAKVISNAFNDFGFRVSMGELFQTPQEAAKLAKEEGVHVVGISTLAGGHKSLVPELIEQLKAEGLEDAIVVCGGVIPRQDYQALYDAGVHAIFGPGSDIPEAASQILKMIPGKNR